MVSDGESESEEGGDSVVVDQSFESGRRTDSEGRREGEEELPRGNVLGCEDSSASGTGGDFEGGGEGGAGLGRG